MYIKYKLLVSIGICVFVWLFWLDQRLSPDKYKILLIDFKQCLNSWLKIAI